MFQHILIHLTDTPQVREDPLCTSMKQDNHLPLEQPNKQQMTNNGCTKYYQPDSISECSCIVLALQVQKTLYH